MKLESVVQGPGFASALYGPLHLSVWDAAATVEQARAAANSLEQLARSEEHIVLMAVLGPSCPPPDHAVRDILTAAIDGIDGRLDAIANIVEGQGFGGAAMRAVLTGLRLVVRSPARHQLACATVDEGSHFLAEHSRGRLTAAEISRAVILVRPL